MSTLYLYAINNLKVCLTFLKRVATECILNVSISKVVLVLIDKCYMGGGIFENL